MTALLEVEGLSIEFGGLKAVDDVSFRVRPGEIVSVIGPNGAGKTTLFNMVSGIYRPSRGRVRLAGEDVTAMEPHLLARRGLSRTFQNLQVFPDMSLLENVMAGHHLREGARRFRTCSACPHRAGRPAPRPRVRCSFWPASASTRARSGWPARCPMAR